MNEEMKKAYFKNHDFKRYVDACMQSYDKTLEEVLELRITEKYYESLQKGGCNERRAQHEQDNFYGQSYGRSEG